MNSITYSNHLFLNRRIQSSHLLIICVITGVLVSCSSTRRLERQLHNEVYTTLGMEESRKDNFALYKEAASWINTPHEDGGYTHSGIDCSGLVYMLYKTVYGKTLERSSARILKKNCEKINLSQLREGDLIFFNTSSRSSSTVNHVGIYLKNHQFIHTSTSKGVKLNSLNESYFQKSWVCGGRVKY